MTPDATRTPGLSCSEQEHTNGVGAWAAFTLHAIPGAGLLVHGIVIQTLSADRYDADGLQVWLPSGISIAGRL